MDGDFRLGEWVVRPQRRIIERGDQSVHLMPKPMSVLECLVATNGAPVSRSALFDAVWPGAEVSDDTLTTCVAELRKAFGDTARESRVIETIPKLGFRLVLPVEPLEEAPPGETQPSPDGQQAVPVGLRKLWPAGLLLIAAMLVPGMLLSFDSSRTWLTEAGNSLRLKMAGNPAPHHREQKPGIAVLPFVNMSSDTRDEYFSDGMTEGILNALANTNRVPVIARTSSFQFKGQSRDIKEIGRLLEVTHVLEGSVRKTGESVRVNAQLIDTATGTHVWSNAYQRNLSDIFILQEAITKDIIAQIGFALGDEFATPAGDLHRVKPMTARRTANAEAYDLYLKGMQVLASTSPAVIEQAAGYFDRAIALDGEYADAWAAKGRAMHVLGRANYGHSQIPATVYPPAIAAYRKALEIEPGHAFAMGWLGEALMLNDFKWDEGMQLMEQSLARNPNDASLLAVYGWRMKTMQIEGADEVLDRAYRLDPFGIVPTVLRAMSLFQDGRPLDALTMIETSLVGDREGYAPNSYAATFHLLVGRLDAAEEHLHQARLAAHPVDLGLDVLGWLIDNRRGKAPLPWAEIWQRVPTERLSYLARLGSIVEWESEQAMVAALELAIDQRHDDINSILFGSKPPLMPEADWRRMKEITGVTQYQLNHPEIAW